MPIEDGGMPQSKLIPLVPSVDPSRSVLWFSQAGSSTMPANGEVRARLLGSAIELLRYGGDSLEPLEVRWSVA